MTCTSATTKKCVSGYVSVTILPMTDNSTFAASSLAIRMWSSSEAINLNAGAFDAEYSASPRKRKIESGGDYAERRFLWCSHAPTRYTAKMMTNCNKNMNA